MPDSEARKPFEIYRATDERDYGEHNLQPMVDLKPEAIAALSQFAHDPVRSGSKVTLAYSRPGFSLTKVWFKSGYPLPLHSHGNSCLYYITAGTIRIGEDVLGVGDGFFVDKDVPYTYEVGPEGVEVLEFRSTDQLNIRFRANTKKSWDKLVERENARQETWATEKRPSEVA